MAETLVEKVCTPCRGGIPPLPREEAERYLGQVPGWELADDARLLRRTFRLAHFREALASCTPSARSPRPMGTTPTCASAGATPPSRCGPRRSRGCTRTTSSWRPRSTAWPARRTRTLTGSCRPRREARRPCARAVPPRRHHARRTVRDGAHERCRARSPAREPDPDLAGLRRRHRDPDAVHLRGRRPLAAARLDGATGRDEEPGAGHRRPRRAGPGGAQGDLGALGALRPAAGRRLAAGGDGPGRAPRRRARGAERLEAAGLRGAVPAGGPAPLLLQAVRPRRRVA